MSEDYIVLWENARVVGRREYARIPAESAERAVEAAIVGYKLHPTVDGLSMYVIERSKLKKMGVTVQVTAEEL